MPSILVNSRDPYDAGTVTVTMVTTITVDDGQGQSTLTLSGDSVVPKVVFDVTLTNPCLTVAIDDIEFSVDSITVI